MLAALPGEELPEVFVPIPSIDQIEQDFAVLEEWEDRYKYIIELGRELPEFDDAFRTQANKVQGCASQVWLQSFISDKDKDQPRLRFLGDSDALIVRGLIAIALSLFSGQPAQQIIAIDASKELERLQLKEHLSPQRSNGFLSLIRRIKDDARLAISNRVNSQA
jgi:cysteine desulfuration protein SufE